MVAGSIMCLFTAACLSLLSFLLCSYLCFLDPNKYLNKVLAVESLSRPLLLEEPKLRLSGNSSRKEFLDLPSFISMVTGQATVVSPGNDAQLLSWTAGHSFCSPRILFPHCRWMGGWMNTEI